MIDAATRPFHRTTPDYACSGGLPNSIVSGQPPSAAYARRRQPSERDPASFAQMMAACLAGGRSA